MKRAVAFCLFVSFSLLLPAAGISVAQAAGDAKNGREFAQKHCSRCHVIGDFNKYGGIGSTPSFQLLASLKDYFDRFQTFFERNPHPSFVRVPGVPRWTKLPASAKPITITPQEIEDVIAFVETLRRK